MQGYYIASTEEFSYEELMRLIGETLHEAGRLESPEVTPLTKNEIDGYGNVSFLWYSYRHEQACS
jgi:hypothetical protein